MKYNSAAVILNYNGVHFLEKFLPNVLENTSEKTEVVVVDNASTDNSVKFLQEHYPSLRLIVLPKNYGYAGGYNYGLATLGYEFFILLNSDIEVTKNWDIPLINRLESEHHITACQPKILAYDNKSYFEYAGGSGGFIDREYFPFCRGRIFGELEQDLGQYDNAREVFWASGACFAIKSWAFHKAKGFDEDFFAHMEEIDLCHRLKNMGHKIYVEPKSVVYHVGGGTLAMMSPFKTFLNYRNGLSLLVKNYPYSDFKFILFKRLLLDGLSAINFVLRGIPRHAIEIYKAHRAFFKDWKLVLDKRERLQEEHKDVNRTGVFNGSAIWMYFVSRKRKFGKFPTRRFVNE
ncbi:glycosyltransferase family 2 protein [Luteibaculum oceani]|uniref:Glycosyltransferase family 2 protein n=1 Tax=Luteibaculum oceani TaxID=1294296 RepID=A0A5C6UUE6_9FLAO|nr:glycosyltransferase family 2 protein [Luteibaculum oceani]TXC77003.1 glycosyltransferase family 2 protein [Luteibaculum oceani]